MSEGKNVRTLLPLNTTARAVFLLDPGHDRRRPGVRLVAAAE